MESEGMEGPLKELETCETQNNNKEIILWFQRVQAACTDTKSANAIIIDLREMLEKKDVDPFNEKSPYYSFLLAHVHDHTGNIDIAINDIELSIAGFKSLGKEKNRQQAIGNWYYGLLLSKQENPDRAKAKIDIAIEIIAKLDKEQRKIGQYNDAHKELIETIKVSFENLTTRLQTNPALSKEKKQSLFNRLKDTVTNIQPRNRRASDRKSSGPQETAIKGPPTPPSDNSSAINQPKSNPHLRHIIIPVDMRAFDNSNIDSTLLESEYFEKLKKFDETKEHQVDQSDNRQSVKNASTQKHIVIPRFPIYGRASAGLNGEPVILNTSFEDADEVDETLQIIFWGKEHKIHFTNSKLTPTFVEGREYGWITITGESMNNASPVKINDKDHVLFYKIHDLEYCAGKIVLALLPDSETQPPQLVIKYLLKLSSPLPLRTDGWSEYAKFVLHSESSLDKDPKTGVSYKNDLEVIREDQIIGEVIAVAKPI